MRIHITRDFKFFNKFQTKDEQQDSIRRTSDKPFSVLDNQQSPGMSCETEIGSSMEPDARGQQANEERNELQGDPNELPPDSIVANNGRAANDVD